jgi:hypothetical protein
MDKDVDFTSLVPGGSLTDEELYWEEGLYLDGTPIDEDELDRLAQDHFALLYDAAYDNAVSKAEYMFEGDR